MKKVDEAGAARRRLEEIDHLADRPLRLMEVCGTHTIAIFRTGIKSLLTSKIELISGPGCPVCITPQKEIDRAIAYSRMENTILATFGDLLRVPGSDSSLYEEKAEGGDIRVVVSPLDAVKLAQDNLEKRVIFFAVGFETTSPAIAFAVREAGRLELNNFFIYSSQRLVPPAIRALLSGKKTKIDGFILPGHVSVIIGSHPYEFIAREFGIPGVITGFDPLDILEGIEMLARQAKEKRAGIEIQYRRVVRPEGNALALKVMEEMFQPARASWRGLGEIPESGLFLRAELSGRDAARVFPLELPDPGEPPGCRCGEVLQGVIRPPECALFSRGCTPDQPVGPCMVSSEGTCAAYYKYGREK